MNDRIKSAAVLLLSMSAFIYIVGSNQQKWREDYDLNEELVNGESRPSSEVSEYLEETKSTVIGEMEVLEKSMYVEEEIASMDGWVVTRDLKYPYFRGGDKKVIDRINEQIFQTIMRENMSVEDWVTYIEMTYDITFAAGKREKLWKML